MHCCLGSGKTDGVSGDGNGNDPRCFSSKTGTADSTTVTTKVRLNVLLERLSVSYGTEMEFETARCTKHSDCYKVHQSGRFYDNSHSRAILVYLIVNHIFY